MKQPVKEIQAYLDYGDGVIHDSDDLISYKISCDSGLCKTAMRKLEAKYLGNHNILGKWVRAVYGVRLPDGTFDFLDYGSFLVDELTVTKDTETTNIVAYDKMVNAMIPYAKLDIEYPVSLIDYTGLLCEACGLELGSVFGRNLWDVSKQRELSRITYDSTTGIYAAEDNDNRTALAYKLQQHDDTTFIGGAVVTKNITSNGVYTFKTTRVENSKRIRIANQGDSKEFSVFYPIPDYIAVGDVFTVTLEVVDCTIGASKFKNVILQKGSNLLSYKPYNPMNSWQITQELWENIDGITYRDILVQIAQATGSTCIIGADDKVYFKELTDTGESLTYDNMFKLKLENKYGEINSVVLSRAPSEDNVFLQDDASIQTNGLNEFRIENNEIIDKDRENAITPIFNVLNGISYYPFEATTEGLGWYEIADNINIVNEAGEVFNTSLFNYSITIDGSIKETLKTTAETKTQTQYQYAKSIAKRVKNAEIIVNKQEQYIKQLVSDVEGVNEKYTQIYQDVENIVHSVQTSGGNNLIKDSVMFAYDSTKEHNDWVVEGDGTLVKESDLESVNNGCTSGHSFILNNMFARQTIKVNGGSNTTYTFSTKIKKNVTGSCYVRIYNTTENHVIEVPSGESAYYKEYTKTVTPVENEYTIEFYGSADSDATFTDNMFALGDIKSQWTQADGEVMNTQVNINIDGVLVKSSVYAGDYTIMSPLEFAGYTNINGTIIRVFSLNRDITEVEKLKARAEITMSPIKIVPITQGDMQGWAFVPVVEV